MVKPLCIPCKYSPQFCQEVIIADDGEHLTVIVGANIANSDLLMSVFGASSAKEMVASERLPSYSPAEESQEAEMFTAFLE
jgi:hypothetical protein